MSYTNPGLLMVSFCYKFICMKINRSVLIFLYCSGLFIFSTHLFASSYYLESDRDSLIGEIKTITSVYDDTLVSIARENGLGYHEIKLFNPEVDIWLPGEGSEILLPAMFLLPHAPRSGIVLNIPEMRLYYFPDNNKNEVVTYPLGIGREGWGTPYVKTNVIQKDRDPYWYPPESIREEHAAKGDPLPEIIGPGPDNPLGKFALRLGLPAYLIHGTNKPAGIGMRVSHGCIRLYPEDIEELYSMVGVGTQVRIVNQPYKLGQHQGKLYLEAHPYLSEDTEQFRENLTSIVSMLIDITEEKEYVVDWGLAKQVIKDMKGVPVVIGNIAQQNITPITVNSDGQGSGMKLRLDWDLEN